ncbi:MAG: hypothetical protein M0R75_03205 [Dehalococcoidia bacterium]|nr:hypothetical protein [Dehalococcoidia bacterium]
MGVAVAPGRGAEVAVGVGVTFVTGLDVLPVFGVAVGVRVLVGFCEPWLDVSDGVQAPQGFVVVLFSWGNEWVDPETVAAAAKIATMTAKIFKNCIRTPSSADFGLTSPD